MSDELTRKPGESYVDFAHRRAKALGIKLAPAPAAVAARPAAPAPAAKWDEDLIPEVEVNVSPERLEMDAVLGGIDLVEAYRRWCGKMEPDVGSKRESIMVSCPNPAHPDANPSAWINLDKGDGGVGHCAGCEQGFDKYDIAAWHFGYDVPGYKAKENFPRLRGDMAGALGYEVMTDGGKDEWLERKDQPPTPGKVEAVGGHDAASPPTPPVAVLEAAGGESAPTIGAVPTRDVDEGDDEFTDADLTFDWRTLPAVTDNSFLHAWMELTSDSFEPEEFYFWEGLMALGHAAGENVVYSDSKPVRANLMICLVGSTGTGKSIAISALTDLLRDALPYQADTGAGVRHIPAPVSGEALVDQFSPVVTDSVTGATTQLVINGYYRESELASLVKKAQRSGNTIREIMMDMFDGYPVGASGRTHGIREASEHFMQVITSTQPGAMGGLLSNNDLAAGFLNRWVYIMGAPKERPAITDFRLDATIVTPLLREIRAWGGTGRKVKFYDGPAADRWRQFFADEIRPLTLEDENWLASRMELLAKKLLLLFAINDKSTTVLVEHVESVAQLWRYLLATYGMTARVIGNDDLESCVTAIERYFRERPEDQITFRQISKQSGARKFKTELVMKAIDLLVKAWIIEEVPRPKAQRTSYYRWVDAPSARALASVSAIKSS